MSENRKAPLTAAIAAAFLAGVITTVAQAKPFNVDNIADVLHPDIHENVTGADGNSPSNNANPTTTTGQGNANGDNLHGIRNNPGQSGADPANGAPGFADQLETVHGGIGAVNPNIP
jgi:hypothetical protein